MRTQQILKGKLTKPLQETSLAKFHHVTQLISAKSFNKPSINTY